MLTQISFRFVLTAQMMILTTAKSVTMIPPSHTTKPTNQVKQGPTQAPSHTTTYGLEVFSIGEIDPKVRPYIDPTYNQSDFDKVVWADGDNYTIVYDREWEMEHMDPEVKKIMEEMENESNDIYYPTEVNYFNQTIDHFLNKTAEELEFLQKRNQIYNDLIDKPAPNVVQVGYGKVSVAMGNDIHAKYTRRMPTFVSWPAEKDAQYCLIMTDPDTSHHSRPMEPREYQLWIVVNIPGNNLTAGEHITEYVRPHPEFDCSGWHRIIFYVFKQTEKNKIYDEIKLSHIPVTSLRKDFSTRNFAKKNHLIGPVALNFFIAQWDKNINEEEEIFGPLYT